MDAKINLMEPLLERAELYGKTSIELLKLQTLDKAADFVSSVASRSLLALAISFFAFMLNVAIALWLGEMLGKYYYGFLVVAFFHILAAIILLLIHPFIKLRIGNSIIRKFLS